MLSELFALSEDGAKKLKAGITATVISNLCLMVPISVLMLLILDLLNQKERSPFIYLGGAFVFLVLIIVETKVIVMTVFTSNACIEI